MLTAVPQRTEPTQKKQMKVSRMLFRPKPSTSPPTSGSTAVDAMVYAPPAQMKSSPWSFSTMVGSVVATAVCSRPSQNRNNDHGKLSGPRKMKWGRTRSIAESMSTRRVEMKTIQKVRPR